MASEKISRSYRLAADVVDAFDEFQDRWGLRKEAAVELAMWTMSHLTRDAIGVAMTSWQQRDSLRRCFAEILMDLHFFAGAEVDAIPGFAAILRRLEDAEDASRRQSDANEETAADQTEAELQEAVPTARKARRKHG